MGNVGRSSEVTEEKGLDSTAKESKGFSAIGITRQYFLQNAELRLWLEVGNNYYNQLTRVRNSAIKSYQNYFQVGLELRRKSEKCKWTKLMKRRSRVELMRLIHVRSSMERRLDNSLGAVPRVSTAHRLKEPDAGINQFL